MSDIKLKIKIPNDFVNSVGFIDRMSLMQSVINYISPENKLFNERVESYNVKDIATNVYTNYHIIHAKIFVNCSGKTALLTKNLLGSFMKRYVTESK